jgi:hypothetical protein
MRNDVLLQKFYEEGEVVELGALGSGFVAFTISVCLK